MIDDRCVSSLSLIVSLHVQDRFKKTCILESDDPLQDLPELPPLKIGAAAIGMGSVDKKGGGKPTDDPNKPKPKPGSKPPKVRNLKVSCLIMCDSIFRHQR